MTAGGAVVPQAFLNDTDAFERALGELIDLPTRGACIDMVPGYSPRIGELGLFAFDSSFNGSLPGGAYRRVTIPSQPLHVAELADSHRTLLAEVTYSELSWSDETFVSGEALRAVRWPGY